MATVISSGFARGSRPTWPWTCGGIPERPHADTSAWCQLGPQRMGAPARPSLLPLAPPMALPPTASLNVILTAVPDEGAPGHGWHCCEQVQKQTLVCFAKIKGFYSALAWGSLPTPLEWSGWGRRGDRSHPLGEEAPPFWVFAGRAAPMRARWPWIIPGVSVPQTLCSSRRVSPARERGLHPGRSKRRTSFAHRPQDPTR